MVSANSVLTRLCKEYEITKEDFFTPSRNSVLVECRQAFFLSLSILGINIHEANKQITKYTHTMPLSWCLKAMERYQLYKEFRNHIQLIVTHFSPEKYEQFEKKNPCIVKKITFPAIIPQKNKVKMYFSEVKENAIKANYTEEDNKRIDFACESAIKFFDKYGTGLEKMPIVDWRKYS